MVHAPPAASGVLHGLAPGGLGAGRLLLAIAIVGATVMPHNLLLHSDLVLSRRSPTASPRRLIRIATMETAVALNLALLLNAAILFVAATVFFHSGTTVTTLREGYETLRPILGQSTAWAFAVALLAASLASGITGALAGQIVLDAFWSARVSPVTRRALVTLPPMILLAFGLGELTILVWSQAVLCVVLVLVASSLVSVAGDRSVMGSYAIGRAPRCIGGAILIALVITNIALLGSVIG
jgi:manganese transport protein